jgi:hypothetical protein
VYDIWAPWTAGMVAPVVSPADPGIGVAAAEWLVTQDPLLVGADNIPVEVSPNPDAQLSAPVHQIMPHSIGFSGGLMGLRR